MDSQTIVTAINITSPPRHTMFNIIETSLHHKSPTHKNPIISKFQENDNGRNKDDIEISIFDDHEYFSETKNPKHFKKQQHQDSALYHNLNTDKNCSNFRTKLYHETEKASSGSSWISQTGLLGNCLGSNGFSPRNSVKKRCFLVKKWFMFGRKYCCIGKKSEQVNEKGDEESITKDTLEIHESNFSATNAVFKQGLSASEGAFVWDGGAAGFNFPILNPAPKPIVNHLEIPKACDDDVGSDGSSDLFEIESFSTQFSDGKNLV